MYIDELIISFLYYNIKILFEFYVIKIYKIAF